MADGTLKIITDYDRSGQQQGKELPDFQLPRTLIGKKVTAPSEQVSLLEGWTEVAGKTLDALSDSITQFTDSIENAVRPEPKERGLITKWFREALHEGFSERKTSQAQKVTASIEALGGKTVELTTKYDDKPWIRHLTAEGFAGKIREAGGRKVAIVSKTIGKTINAIEIETAKSEKLLESLAELNILDKTLMKKEPKASWSLFSWFGSTEKAQPKTSSILPGTWKQIQVGDKIYLIEAADEQAFYDAKPLSRNRFTGKLDGFNSETISIEQKPWGETTQQTIVLSGGAHSKIGSQAMASMAARYLALGINVVLLDDKQVRESETEESMVALRETTGRYLKASGLSNKDITWHGICYSATIAAKMAKSREFQGSGLIFDQGYENGEAFFKRSIKSKLPGVLLPFESLVDREIDRYIKENPNLFNVEGRFNDIQGNVLMIVNRYDEELSRKTTDSLAASMFNGERVANVANLTNPNLSHGQAWYLDPKGGATTVFGHLLEAGVIHQSSYIQ